MSLMQKINYLGARFSDNDVENLKLDILDTESQELFRTLTPIVDRVYMDVSQGSNAQGDVIRVRSPISVGQADKYDENGESFATPWTAESTNLVLNHLLFKEVTIHNIDYSTASLNDIERDASAACMEAVSSSMSSTIYSEVLSKITNTCGGGGTGYDSHTLLKAASFMDQKKTPQGRRYVAMGSKMYESLHLNDVKGTDPSDPRYQTGYFGNPYGLNVFKDVTIGEDLEGLEQNFIYDKNAIVVAARTIEGPVGLVGSANISNVIDPFTGVPMRRTIWHNPKANKTHLRWDILFGVSLVNPNAVAMILPTKA